MRGWVWYRRENGSFFESAQKRDADKRLFPGGTQAACRLEVHTEKESGGRLFSEGFSRVRDGGRNVGLAFVREGENESRLGADSAQFRRENPIQAGKNVSR